MKVAKDMIPADLAIVPFVSIKGNYIIKDTTTPGDCRQIVSPRTDN